MEMYCTLCTSAPLYSSGGSAETDLCWDVLDGDLILFFQTQHFDTFLQISISNPHVLERPYSIIFLDELKF